MMTPQELDEIEARARAATEGPWTSVFNCRDCDEIHMSSLTNGQLETPCGAVDEKEATQKDREFIAHARTDVPKLVEEVRRLQREVDELQERVSGLKFWR
jgi:hypothetical protein